MFGMLVIVSPFLFIFIKGLGQRFSIDLAHLGLVSLIFKLDPNKNSNSSLNFAVTFLFLWNIPAQGYSQDLYSLVILAFGLLWASFRSNPLISLWIFVLNLSPLSMCLRFWRLLLILISSSKLSWFSIDKYDSAGYYFYPKDLSILVLFHQN